MYILREQCLFRPEFFYYIGFLYKTIVQKNFLKVWRFFNIIGETVLAKMNQFYEDNSFNLEALKKLIRILCGSNYL